MASKKIMIIDDEPDVTTYLSAILKSNGYESFQVRDISKAMDIVHEVSPDLICLDIMMPGETGISFYIKLRQDKKFEDIPVIIISGVIESDKFNFRTYVTDKNIQAPQYYMEKPINVERYIEHVKQLTQKRNDIELRN